MGVPEAGALAFLGDASAFLGRPLFLGLPVAAFAFLGVIFNFTTRAFFAGLAAFLARFPSLDLTFFGFSPGERERDRDREERKGIHR